MKPQEDKTSEFKNLSHDIQNILSTVVNNAQLLKQTIDSTGPAARYIDIIENNSLRASEIIQEFLAQKKTQKRKIDVSILFDDIASSFVNTLPANIKFEFEKDQERKTIFGNYTELFRVFLNLLINAKEAVAENGIIIFENKIQHNNEQISFSVKDSGIGIPHELIDKIFQPNFSTKNKGRESGMGLSIVKNIVEDHNGTIKVESEINKGTEFRIYLPIFIEEKHGLSNNKKILIADDDNSLRESLADLFESYGYETIQAKDGNTVLEILMEEKGIDLLIIDKKMPGKDGLKCISEIRSFNKGLPIVLVTGINFEEDEFDRINTNHEINKIIKKPYDFVYLKDVVESLLF